MDKERPNNMKTLLNNTMSDILIQASNLGFQPATVIDVGVAHGTKALYTVFPGAFHLLIEPLSEFTQAAETILKTYKGEFINAAASFQDGECILNVHPEHLLGSSVFKEEMGPEFDGFQRKVKTVKVDTIIRLQALEGPYLLKVDVQGAELEVLNGASSTLMNTDLVLLEVSLFEFMKGAPQLSDIVLYMKEKNFVVYDIYGGSRRPLDGALGQVDMAFVKEKGFFRKDHRYATGEQWARIVSQSSPK
jgi:FkbM family methyltransferase